jgi:hypothetical protein
MNKVVSHYNFLLGLYNEFSIKIEIPSFSFKITNFETLKKESVMDTPPIIFYRVSFMIFLSNSFY